MLKILFKICIKFNFTSIFAFFYYLYTNAISKKNGIYIDKIKNLKMDERLNAHDIFYSSKVICGFNSTVLLEAAKKNKFVITPIFQESLKKKYEEFIFFLQYLKYFKVANSKNELNKIIKQGVKHKNSFSKMLKHKKQLFYNFISSFSKKINKNPRRKDKRNSFENSIYLEKR